MKHYFGARVEVKIFFNSSTALCVREGRREALEAKRRVKELELGVRGFVSGVRTAAGFKCLMC